MIDSNYHINIFRAIPTPCLLLLPNSPEFTISQANNAFLRLSGCEESLWTGRSIFDFYNTCVTANEPDILLDLSELLTATLKTAQPCKMVLQRRFLKNFLNPNTGSMVLENVPVLDLGGKIIAIMHFMNEAEMEPEDLGKNLIDATRDLVWSVDMDMRIITANHAYLQMMKIATGKDIAEGDFVLCDELGHELNEKWKKYYGRVFNDEKFSVREKVYNPIKNRIEYGLVTLNPIYNRDGKLFGAACFSKDITVEVDISLELQRSKEELSKIMDSSLDVICTIDDAGKFVKVSAAAERIWGYSPAELIGRSHLDFVYPDDLNITIYTNAAIKTGLEMTNFQNKYIRKDGSLVPIVWSARWDKKEKLIYCVARDATERMNAEFEMNLLVNYTEERFMLLNKDLQIVSLNQQFVLFFKEYFGQDIWKGDFILDFARPGRREVVQAIYDRVLTGQSETAEVILPDFRQNEHIFSVNYKPSWNDLNEINGVFVGISDVTDVAQAQKRIASSEEKYRLLFYESPLPKWIYDLESRYILEVNEAAIAQYGFSRDEFMNMTVGDLGLESKWTKPESNGVRSSDHTEIITHRRKNGTQIKVEISRSFYSYLGKDCLIVVSNDVTVREDALKKVKENEARLINAQKIAKLGSWQRNWDGDGLYWSDEMYNIWEVSKDSFQINFDNVIEMIHPEDRETFTVKRDQYLNGEKDFDIEHRIILADGSIKWVTQTGKRVRDKWGNLLKFEGTLQDITSQKLLALSLEESNLRYNYLTKATSDAIWDWNLITEIIYWGEGFNNIFGYDLNELKNDISSWTDHVHPSDIERVVNSVYEALDSKETKWTSEYRYQKMDQSYAYVTDKGFIIRDNHGKAIRMVGSMQDISKRKEEEYRLKLLESVITNTTDAVMITEAFPLNEPGPKIIYVNRAFTLMTGYAAEEVIGKTPRILQGQKNR
ncbi:PAS domain S-box protein [Dyadobacter sp. NIV53]|uniref:PAS domain S-box protein n=1 Tax=Dyadobacter sp. NIV53 TaxID=2861765 RepID=UPI001C87638A|nr:PAS domain S-box protein [Dyadobacter sp. NIV53]